MTKLLAGGAAALFGEILSPMYLAGRVVTVTTAYAPDGTMTREEATAGCLVQVDAATEEMVNTEGYTADDRAIYVLRSSFAGPLDSDAQIAVDEGPYAGTRWRVATPINGDPAAAYWLCRGVLQKADPDG